MQYLVASVKDETGRESVVVYAADRADALQAVQGLFVSPPVQLGEISGMQSLLTTRAYLTGSFQALTL